MHRTATAFSGAAEAYERARPEYPDEAVRFLAQRFAIAPGTRLLDLAAGTGKLTRALLGLEATVVAVEPVAGMRRTLAQAVPGAAVVAGVAQAIPLGAGTVDVVTVAQAFHWFASPPAVREVHRVLRPGGGLAVLWNRRDLEDPFQRTLQQLMAPWRGPAPTHESGEWRRAVEGVAGGRLFRPEGRFEVAWRQPLDVEGVVARVASVSFIAAMDQAARARLLGEVRDAAVATRAPISLPYLTEVFAYRRTP